MGPIFGRPAVQEQCCPILEDETDSPTRNVCSWRLIKAA